MAAISKMAADKIGKISMNPRNQFSLKSETIDNLTILLAVILKMVASQK
jgi:hypothetical protein